MEMKILWGGALVVVGWLAYYLFGRQFIFNFVTAFPLIKKMKETDKDLIADTAKKYTTTSAAVTGLICAVICFVILYFCPLYLKISFFAGVIISAVMFKDRLSADNRDMFDSFCGTYYRFVPDDELRTAMFNRKPSQMKLRLHDMNLSTAFIPDFKKEN